MLKKTLLASAIISLSLSAYAGAPGNAMVVPTGTPLLALDSVGSWSVGLGVLYAKSSSPIFQYAQVITPTATGNTVSNKTVDPTAQAGLMVDATYHFAGSSRDVGLFYTHLNMDNSNTASISGDETFDEPFGLIPSRRDHVDQIKASTHDDYNGTDFVFGQHFMVGNRVDLHPFGGLRYADLDTRNNSTYFNDPTDVDPIEATAQLTSHYEGLGPRAGMDGKVILCANSKSNLSLVGTIAGSLEYGYNDAQVITQINADLPHTTDLDNNWYVVPELDAHLGVNYMIAFNPTTSMNVELGYQAVNYFNAIENNSGDINDVNSVIARADFGFQGPYAHIQLNIA